LHPGRAVSTKQEAKLYDAAFMKAVSIETAGNGFRHTVRKHFSFFQTFFQIGCFSHLKPQTDRLEKQLLAQRL
jgi:hypothetical protein